MWIKLQLKVSCRFVKNLPINITESIVNYLLITIIMDRAKLNLCSGKVFGISSMCFFVTRFRLKALLNSDDVCMTVLWS